MKNFLSAALAFAGGLIGVAAIGGFSPAWSPSGSNSSGDWAVHTISDSEDQFKVETIYGGDWQQDGRSQFTLNDKQERIQTSMEAYLPDGTWRRLQTDTRPNSYSGELEMLIQREDCFLTGECQTKEQLLTENQLREVAVESSRQAVAGKDSGSRGAR